MRFDILTLFPEIVDPYIQTGVIGRAHTIKKTLDIKIWNIREFSSSIHKKVDDSPFGGGAGMIMQVEPIYNTLTTIYQTTPETIKHVILTKAGAPLFTQQKSIHLAQIYNHIIFICGRYEGIDARVEDFLSHESLSIGQYVLTGGELPSLVMLDAIARNIPNVLGNPESLAQESWQTEYNKEYPQYSRPEIFTPPNPKLVKQDAPEAWEVPSVLLSGNHQAIETWKENNTSY